MGQVLLAIILGLGFLHAFFRTLETHWPTSYHSLTSGPGYAISATPLRYLLFRFGPVFVTCLFAAVSLARAGRAVVAPVLAIAIGHALLTVGRAQRVTMRRRDPRLALVVMHLVVGLGVVETALVALALNRTLAGLVPSTEELATTLWTALFAAVTGAYLVTISRARHQDTPALLRRSRSTISDDLWHAAANLASEASTDPYIVQAFMLVENLQRPPWFRSLERLWGRVGGPGTYGIVQVSAPKGPPQDCSREVVLRCAGVGRGAGAVLLDGDASSG